MHKLYVQLVAHTAREKYGNVAAFYQNYLQLTAEQWHAWCAGTYRLSESNHQKVKSLFSDYEWMLIEKILRQTMVYPEKRQHVVGEYQQTKAKIAQKWLDEGLAEMVVQENTDRSLSSNVIHLIVKINYDIWGFDDQLYFWLPKSVRPQLASNNILLLEWVEAQLKENLAEE